jgi:hypothetical protein
MSKRATKKILTKGELLDKAKQDINEDTTASELVQWCINNGAMSTITIKDIMDLVMGNKLRITR